MTHKEKRQAAGLSLTKTAAGANVAEATVRLFEADPRSVGDRSRRKLVEFYAGLGRPPTSPTPSSGGTVTVTCL